MKLDEFIRLQTAEFFVTCDGQWLHTPPPNYIPIRSNFPLHRSPETVLAMKDWCDQQGLPNAMDVVWVSNAYTLYRFRIAAEYAVIFKLLFSEAVPA